MRYNFRKKIFLIGAVMFSIATLMAQNISTYLNDQRTSNDIPGMLKLDGAWQFQLDSLNEGIKNEWYNRKFNDVIHLPGTTDENKKGRVNNHREAMLLTRVYFYEGAAWYQKEIDIPQKWENKNFLFTMERTKTSYVWVDSHYVGTQNSLSTTHLYDLSKYLSPGKHRITVCINNAEIPPLGDSHQISSQTQTNWNGILGKVELHVKDSVWIKDVLVYPDVAQKKVDIRVSFNADCKGNLVLSAHSWNTKVSHVVNPKKVTVDVEAGKYFETSLSMGNFVQLWDEFSPALYKLKIDFSEKTNGKENKDYREVNFGMRKFSRSGTQFQVNDKTIFLRGKHDACVFPLTGYAPMNVDEWVRILRIAKSYGINHYRFHTWCPPNAAFEAADIVGIYMQPELPLWAPIGRIDTMKTDGDVELKIDNSPEKIRIDYVVNEGKRILDAFGGSPSFCMFALGNELIGEEGKMAAIVNTFRTYDSRHLYAQGSNNFLFKPLLLQGDDYWTTTFTGGENRAGVLVNCGGLDVRASYGIHTAGHINNVYPSTDYDYTSGIKNVPIPVIGHEVGQYQIYPNYNEIKKYTGVLQARNFDIFRERLNKAGMLEQADDFFRASGALSVICYREEIESAIRTKGFGGFQLLDLQDFPGQGTALVGILDAFMDSKGLITPAEWRQFCSEIVPLVRMKKYVWTNAESFSSLIEVANYSTDSIKDRKLQWKLVDASDKLIAKGKFEISVPQGELSSIGEINLSLSKLKTPQCLGLQVFITGTDAINSYPIWVYPSKVNNDFPQGINVVEKINDTILDRLENGANVLFLPDSASLSKSIEGAFQSDFWNYRMFKRYGPPGTLGILCNPQHPIFENFPTEFHSNWQWWSLLKNGRAMILDKTPVDFRPTVQVIDNFTRNHKLGVIFECKVGKGSILVCSCNLLKQQDKPEARQLLHTILEYMKSNDFDPDISLSVDNLKQIFLN